MFTRLFKFLAMGLPVLLLAAGCTSPDEVVLDKNDNGSQVTLEIGQTLAISLPSNPTTGYVWEAVALEQAVLAAQGEPEYTADSDGNLVGSGGTETFHFKAIASGRVELTLIYHRPFEADVEPIETFTVTIEVR